MKIWLDDVRPPPGPGWRWVTDAREAISILESGMVEQISLDHDLGVGVPTGYEVALYIEEGAIKGWLPRIRRMSVHSQNPAGRDRIAAALRGAKEAWDD